MNPGASQQPAWKLLRNGVAVFLGEGVSRLGNFVVAIIIARQFGASALGQYGYAVSVASIFLLIPDMGLHLTATKRVAACADELPRVFWNLLWLKLALLAAAMFCAVVVGKFTMEDDGRRLLFYVLTLRVGLLTFSQAYMAFYRASEHMHFVSLQQAIGVMVSLLALPVCFAVATTPRAFVGALVAGQLAEVCAGWKIIQHYFRPGSPRACDPAYAKEMLCTALPVGSIAILQAATLRIDILVLGAFASNAELGYFQAAAWLLILTFLAASLLMSVLFPRLVRILHSPSAKGTAWVESLIQNGVFLSLGVATVACLGAPYFLRACYGQNLVAAAPHLRVLSTVVPFLFLNTILFYIYVATDQRQGYLAALILSTCSGFALSLLLTPRFGGLGAGIADLARESLLSVVLLFTLGRQGLIQNLRVTLLRIGVASVSFMVIFVILAGARHSGEAWATAWICTISACSLLFLGMPKRDQILKFARQGG